MFSLVSKKIRINSVLGLVLIAFFAFTFQSNKPTIFLVGDSTMAGSKNPKSGGWGAFLKNYVDTSKFSIVNSALPGTSSRTFFTGESWNKKDAPLGGLWDTVQVKIKKGDVVFIQFGHNDASPISDTSRCRGSIKGTNNDTTTKVVNYLTKKEEIVHSYGWYVSQMIKTVKSKGATPILLSYTPRNEWMNGKIIRDKFNYALWAREVATKEKIDYLDVNHLVASQFETEIPDSVTLKYYVKPSDVVHTSPKGSDKVASIISSHLKNTKFKYLFR